MNSVQTIILSGTMACVLAAASFAAGAEGTDADVPDFSGTWEGPGFDLAPPENGGPGPVTNISKDVQKPEGDYKNPLLQPWAARQVKYWAEETHAGRAPLHAHALCYPTSVPGAMTLHQGYLFLQEKNKVTIVIANQAQVRHVYLDVPHAKNVKPSWYGDSVGHYEGGTLVIDTIGIKTKDVVPLDRFGTPHSEKLHVVERIRKTGPNALRIDYRVEDPGVFTAPWDASLSFHPFKEEWGEDPCPENNVDPFTGKPVAGMPLDLHPAF
ncbi:MAG TPA: hypothetical protein VHT51_11705 [Micropepsaceae bacterium]|jgi:hypothetical protein|nr:hypothetical protein [Micropepsaceae bacterium]